MKKQMLFLALALLSESSLIAQNMNNMESAIKPRIVTEKPAPADFFFSNKATKPDKVDREAPVVITQFNVSIPQDQEFYARTGGIKRDASDAQVLLKFHISNLDNSRFQKATDELADYLKERLLAQGFKTGAYTDFSSGKKYASLELKPSPKGGVPELFGIGSTVPGEFKAAPKAVMFTAYDQQLYPQQSMKIAYIALEKKINILTFGWVLNFMVFDTKTGSSSDGKSVEVSFSEQLYGDPFIIMSCYNMKGSIWIQPNTTERPKDAIYGYSYGRSFATKIDKQTGDVEVDNDKFIAAYLELGKSYIDNMTALMAPSDK